MSNIAEQVNSALGQATAGHEAATKGALEGLGVAYGLKLWKWFREMHRLQDQERHRTRG